MVHTATALIPLRGGSKSIPGKNIKLIAGKPLCGWVLEAATAAKQIDTVYVSTDCPETAALVRGLELGVRIVDRPAEFATDEASTEAVMLHFMEQHPCETLVTIQATSPLLRPEDLDVALTRFKNDGLDSMLSAVRTKRFFWNDDGSPINYNPLHRPRRQEFSGTLMENGAFYITERAILDRYRCRLGGRIGIHEMGEHTALELDEPEDWTRVEALLLRQE